MRASQYKAIRDAGVEEFAIYPADVACDLPWPIEHANKEQSVRACPRGLVKATILGDDVKWSEAFTLGCGDTEYQRERRNGVLVEISLESLRATTKESLATIRKQPRTKIRRTPQPIGQVVEMIVSKASIMAPWNEYALVEAEREKAEAERKVREDRLNAAVAAVGARNGSYHEISGKWDKKKEEYLPPEDYDYTVSAAERSYYHGVDRTIYVQGAVVLSLARAEEIAAILAKIKT